MEAAQSLYAQLQYNIDHADPRTKDWPLVWSNPVYVWVLTALYLAVVFLGPRFMKNRQAFSLTGFLVFYNLALVALSAYMFIEIYLSAYYAGYNFVCMHFNEESIKNPNELRVAKVMWWYFFSKAIELLDTVLMVLRKKNSQITFLHCFHHASMLNMWWWVVMWIPGGNSYFGSSLNCLVHVVMYLYYGLSAIPSLRNKLWWKKYITKFQLVQFIITLSHTSLVYYLDCNFPHWGIYLLGGYMVIMLVLFSNFYYQTYKKAAAARAAHKAAALQNGSSSSSSSSSGLNGVNSLNGMNGHAKKHE